MDHSHTFAAAPPTPAEIIQGLPGNLSWPEFTSQYAAKHNAAGLGKTTPQSRGAAWQAYKAAKGA